MIAYSMLPYLVISKTKNTKQRYFVGNKESE